MRSFMLRATWAMARAEEAMRNINADLERRVAELADDHVP